MRIAQKLWWAVVLASGMGGMIPFSGTATGQTQPAHREIVLVEGSGELLQFQNDIKTIAVSEPKIADAVVISPREVMVNAKGPGTTTLVVWEGNAAPQRYEITVSKDNAEWENVLKKLQENANGAAVTFSGTAETIVLTGSVKSPEESKRLASLAQSRSKNVVNLLQAPPPPEPRQILLQVKIADVNRVALSQIGFNLFSTNPKLQGSLTTEQFAAPRFSPIQAGTPTSVNFSDLLNL